MQKALGNVGAEDIRVEEQRVTFVVPTGDARQRLSSVLCNAELPPPETFVFGEFSLHELYRTLYGEEGV